ncbi:uncharacterized protein LOC142625285 [Castanea sativa]|uniref:uncharacterized protein LOC142625285 n=1 Tax=Castanea sativa TaxID=21020 RepID=UPI003F6546E6
METKLGGDRAREITDCLPFDGAIYTDMIKYAGGLWLLWHSNMVEIQSLVNMEQEIHVEVKVRSSNLTWIFSAVYASPRSEERIILWENLARVADLHNLPWVMAGDFNEPLIDEDKFGAKGLLGSANRIPHLSVQWHGRMSEKVKCSLSTMVSIEEIKGALWSMIPYKAPRPNSLHAGFFQRFWLITGDSISREVKRVFATSRAPDYLNKTLIVLIPKMQGPETLGYYRPISLCNTIYKIITKLIVARIRPHLNSIISPYQAAFIPGRKGMDNIIIAQELIHTMGRTKRGKGYMAIKIDLEKAYDKIEWAFIREILFQFNFSENIIDLIMSCVSSVSTSLLFNRSCLESFYPSRAIRQGDPLSPYLFILCMEYLGYLIEKKCAAKLWSPAKASRSGPAFSHIFFADDLILFARDDQVNFQVIKEVLEVFCRKSGQFVSEAKSQNVQLPEKILKGIDRVNRNFLWGSTDNSRKMHWVSWEEVTAPKELGGLGLQLAKGWNMALLAKLNWRFPSEGNALWAKVLKLKYGTRQRINSRDETKLPRSPIWRSLKKREQVFKEAIPFDLPPEIKESIQAVPFPIAARSVDKLAWKGSSKGGFSSKGAYRLATQSLKAFCFPGSWIWKTCTLPKIQMFIWKCMHNSVGVRSYLAKRGLHISLDCPLCHTKPETISHALRDCKFVKPIWQQLGQQKGNQDFFS